ncbi:flagellar protein FlaG [Helicobacter cinaedi PAGU611]|uniref:FlaG protein n=2 Tax=Helicobacter cinaedi TaxID=213 RepID=A0AAI8MP65_9HELI|nr:FlaG family protein [Helicobacter cinaedi]AWK62293.1 flagellar biosynthesis protein FlaG [Helicobacter cinaedi]EFR45769.1 FlaG protein [Helicobacter cinaedi CCUG 18818 = ATCC BAA-847]QOQ90951.1 flagellar protein FlaG [Helicobacter cinaedi]QOQ97068.1 flagellar protein FlaG [Helicobacter cinaedi]BAM12862.1 flagellar protein FlaG [Helicobacter cinaedi PAGU611]
MINSINSVENNNDAVKNRIVNMVNASGRAITEDTRPTEVRLQQETAQHHDKENKKQLESELRELSKKLNEEMKKIGTDLNFSYNENIPGLMVTVKEFNGDKVIREIPSKEAIELMKRMREVIGVIFDKQG